MKEQISGYNKIYKRKADIKLVKTEVWLWQHGDAIEHESFLVSFVDPVLELLPCPAATAGGAMEACGSVGKLL
jgi:hypothetical protein